MLDVVLPVVVLVVVVLVVVVLVLVLVPGVVAGSGSDSVGEPVIPDSASGAVPEPAAAGGPGDWALPFDEFGDDAESSAQATPFPVAMAVPIPNATARRPTRPM